MPKPKLEDFDPESLLDPAPSSSSDDEQSDFSAEEDTNAGREHYYDVGKSKLRKKDVVPLGPQYTGSRISRDVAEDEDSDDPFARGFDEEGSDDEEDSVDGIGNGIDFNGLDAPNRVESGSQSERDGSEDGSEEEFNTDEDMESADGIEEDEEQDEGLDNMSDHSSSDDESTGEKGSQLREMMKDSKALASTLTAGTQSDIAKGAAIKRQRKTFDSILNTRIRLQKALISTNSMAAEAHKAQQAPEAAIEAAEVAALTLLNNITDLRASLEEERTGQKRKRTPFASSTLSSNIWDSINSSENAVSKQQKATLEKWSIKTRGVSATSTVGRLNATAQQTLTEVLDSTLANSTHLIARTQTPRSCAPLQAASSKPMPDPQIYDDADFYGLLLKELLEQRSADLSSSGTAEFVVQAPWQVAREAKTRKVVDTKASKGRRLRYTVHEKLQNFMAPEERALWGERQRDDLFSSLFGQRLGLGEHDEVESEQEDAVDAEEQGLMLFRN